MSELKDDLSKAAVEAHAIDVKAERLKQEALAALKDSDSWVERHPTLTLVGAVLLFVALCVAIFWHRH